MMTHTDAKCLGWYDSYALSCLLSEQHHLMKAQKLTHSQLATSSCKQDISAKSSCKSHLQKKSIVERTVHNPVQLVPLLLLSIPLEPFQHLVDTTQQHSAALSTPSATRVL